MAEKKVEVEINGKKFRVAEHLVKDMMKFGATLTKRTIKNPPPEVLNFVPKKVILPETKPDLSLPSEPVKSELPGEPAQAPELKTEEKPKAGKGKSTAKKK